MKFEVENINELDELTLKRKEGKIATKSFSRIYFGVALYTIIAGLVFFGICAFLYFKFGPDKATGILNNSTVYIGLNVFSMYIVAFPLFLLYVKPIPKRAPFSDVNIGAKEFLRLFFVSVAIMQLGNVLASLLSTFIRNQMEYAPTTTTSSDIISSLHIIPLILFVVILGPIVEELIFRKALIDRLGKYGEGMAVAVSSIAFGLFHGNLNQFIYTTLFGFILGNLYVKCGKIRYPIFLHMLANLFGTLPSLVMQNVADYRASSPDTASKEYLISTILSIAVPIFFLVCIGIGVIVLIRAKKTGLFDYYYNCEIALSPIRRLRCILLNSGAICFIALSVLSIISNLLS